MTFRAHCHVLVIGAGLCGLGMAISIALAGHKVSVFETAPQIHEVGAGIQVTPNGVRILRRWGVLEELESKTANPDTFTIIRFDRQKILTHRKNYAKELESRYGESFRCIHRVDLQKALAAKAISLGVRIFFDSNVRGLDLELPAITLQNGHVQKGDLVIAADGLWSSTRGLFLGKPLAPQPTGDLVYRIVLTLDQVKDEAELCDIITRAGLRIWMGPGAHAVAYSLRNGEMLNVVLALPDDLPRSVAKAEGIWQR